MSVAVGKILLVVGLCIQAFLLMTDNSTIKDLQKDLALTLSHHKFITSQIFKKYLNIIIGGLLSTSILFIITRNKLSKVLVLIGLFTLLIVKFDPFYKLPSYKQRYFWQILAMIGGVFYLMGIQKKKKQLIQNNFIQQQ